VRPFAGLRAEGELRRTLGRSDAQHAIGHIQRLNTLQRDLQPEVAAEDQLIGFEQRLAHRHFAVEAGLAVSFLSH